MHFIDNTISLNSSCVVVGDALKVLQRIPANSIQCVVTSPPYWGMRDYESENQIGAELNLTDYIGSLRAVFSEVKRVLKDDGLLWLNIGDGYTSGNRKYRANDKKNPARQMQTRPDTPTGLKSKDLLGIPWRLAFALQDDGWYLRNDIIWHKPNAMPESVSDRPYRNHEYLFMFSKSERYFFDNKGLLDDKCRKRRSVWEVPIKPNSLKHNAVFPEELITPCVTSSTKANTDFVLDPFFGSGTVGVVCEKLNRKFVGIELNPNYVSIAINRLNKLMENNFTFLPNCIMSQNSIPFAFLEEAI